MAADSDGDLIETVVTCQGDLTDPDFPAKFKEIVDKLNGLLCKGKGPIKMLSQSMIWEICLLILFLLILICVVLQGMESLFKSLKWNHGTQCA